MCHIQYPIATTLDHFKLVIETFHKPTRVPVDKVVRYVVKPCLYGVRLMRALGFTRQPRCAATLHTVLRRVDREDVEAKLGAWAEGLLSGARAPQDIEEGSVINGKTLQ